MNDLVLWLNDAMQGSSGLALVAALAWGAVSVLLSPCHLGTIPLIVGVVGSTEAGQPPSKGRAAGISFSFAGGMLLAIAILAVLVTAAGWAIAGLGSYTNYLIALIFLLAGLNLVGLVPMPSLGPKMGTSKRKGRLAAAGLGLVFGVGLSPCTFAFLAPILAMAFGSAAQNPVAGMALLLAFGVGHTGVIGLAGTSAGLVQRYLHWNSESRGLAALKMVSGVLLFVSASVLIYSA